MQIIKNKKLQTMPYRPQCNGQCECFNSTLISVIGTLPTEAKIRWQEHLPTLVHACNSSHSNTTGFSPFYLMYGRQPMLPDDVQFSVRTPGIVFSTSHSYIQKLQERLEWAYKLPQEISKKESECSKRRYDQNVKCTMLEPGDLVLDMKLSRESINLVINMPYWVIQCVGEHLLIYKVQLVGKNTKTRTLHRILLFPLTWKNENDEIQQNLKEKEPKLLLQKMKLLIMTIILPQINTQGSMKDQLLGVELRE